MRCLVLGGTGFLGAAIVQAAAAAGHHVSILARGETRATPMPEATVLRADRHDALDLLNAERFDLIFDTCAYAPDAVRALLAALAAPPRRYALVSSASVYGDYSRCGIMEADHAATASRADLDLAAALPPALRADPAAYGPAYGPLKRACEIVATEALGEAALVLRAGLLVGPGDPSDRLAWWLRRIDAGGRIAVPGPAQRSVQMIDMRDLAQFAVEAAAAGRSGVYNVTGPPTPLRDMLACAIGLAGTGAEPVWLDEDRFWSAGVRPWSDLPLVTPPTETYRHFMEIDTRRAMRDGLHLRPLASTLADVLAWDRSDRDRQLRCGVPRAVEQAILD